MKNLSGISLVKFIAGKPKLLNAKYIPLSCFYQ